MKRKILAVLLIIIILLTGCTINKKQSDAVDAEKKSDYDFIFVCPIVENEYWYECANGIKQADEELGTNTKIIGPQTADNFSAEIIKYMEQAIAEKPDGIIAYAGIEALAPLIEQASRQSIPVLALDSDAPSTSRIAYVGTDSYNSGHDAGEKVIELTGGKAKIGILVSSLSAEKEMEVISAFRDTVHDYDMEIVAIEETNADPDIAEEKARQMLEEHPEITAIFNTAGYNVTGAARVKKELGLDRLVLVGFDDIEENLQFVREGIIDAIIVQRIKNAGYQSVYIMKEYIDNGRLPKQQYDSGIIMVTKENVDSYNSQDTFTNSGNEKVRVGYYTGDINFQNGFDDEARKSGYAYEYYQAIASVVGWNYEYIFGSRNEMISKLENGEIDIIAGIHKTSETEGKMLFSEMDMGIDDDNSYFAVNNERSDLLDSLNYAMEQIAKNDPNYTLSLHNKYYSTSSLQVLNDAEKEWLAGKASLKIGYVKYNLPLSDIDSDGNPTGVIKDLISIIEQYAHVEIIPICFETTDDMRNSLKNGGIDVGFPIYSDLWLNENDGLCQTDTVISDRIMIIYRGSYSTDIMNNVAISNTDLAQKHYIEENYPNANMSFYSSRAEALDAILNGDEKCLVGCSSTLQRFLSRNSKYQSLNIAYLDATEDLAFAVNKSDTLLLGILNKAIRHADDATITSSIIKYSGNDSAYTLSEFVQRNSLLFVSCLTVFIALLVFLFVGYFEKTRKFKHEQKKDSRFIGGCIADSQLRQQSENKFPVKRQPRYSYANERNHRYDRYCTAKCG